MAALQDLARALREKFAQGAPTQQVQEILIFIQQFANSPKEGAKENAHPKTRKRSTPEPNRAQETLQNASSPPHGGKTRHAQQQAREARDYAHNAPQRESQAADKAEKLPKNAYTNGKSPISPQPGGLLKPTYAQIARKGEENPKNQISKRKNENSLPQSLKMALKGPKPIKIGFQKPNKASSIELIAHIKEKAVNGESLIKSIKAFKAISPKTTLVYSNRESEKALLLENTTWLDAIHASIYSRNYSIVIHGVKRSLTEEEILKRIREQNLILENERDLAIKWLNRGDERLFSPIRIDIKDPIVANRAIQQGITLDYELKRVFQYIPRRKQAKSPQKKSFYKEKRVKIPGKAIFSASQEIASLPDQEEDWILVEGTQKRRILTPKQRGRPKTFEKVNNSHGNITKFLALSQEQPGLDINVD